MDRRDAIHTASTPDQVVGEVKPKRRNRKRTARATIERRINATARDRQVAWAEREQARETERLTVDLDHLYGDLREDRRSAYATGQEPEGTPYRGTTARTTR